MHLIKEFVFIFFLSLSLSSSGQTHPILKSATALSTLQGVEFKLTIRGGSTCQGIQLFEFSQKDSQTTLVAEIVGVCGDTEEETVYTLVHEGAKEFDTSHYQFSFGGQGRSDIFPHFYWPRNKELQIVRSGNTLQVFLGSKGLSTGVLTLFDMSGKRIKTTEIVNQRAELNISEIATSGIFLLRAVDREQTKRVWRKIWISRY